MASFILKGFVTNDGIDRMRNGNQRRRRRAYAPTTNTAVHDNNEKIHTWVSFSLFGYWAPLGDPTGRRSSANNVDISINDPSLENNA